MRLLPSIEQEELLDHLLQAQGDEVRLSLDDNRVGSSRSDWPSGRAGNALIALSQRAGPLTTLDRTSAVP